MSSKQRKYYTSELLDTALIRAREGSRCLEALRQDLSRSPERFAMTVL